MGILIALSIQCWSSCSIFLQFLSRLPLPVAFLRPYWDVAAKFYLLWFHFSKCSHFIQRLGWSFPKCHSLLLFTHLHSLIFVGVILLRWVGENVCCGAAEAAWGGWSHPLGCFRRAQEHKAHIISTLLTGMIIECAASRESICAPKLFIMRVNHIISTLHCYNEPSVEDANNFIPHNPYLYHIAIREFKQ